MIAPAILNELILAGATVRRQGDKVRLKGADVIPAELLARARAERAAILAALPDPAEQRRRLLAAALREGIDRAVVDALDDADLLGIEHWSDCQLRTCVRWHQSDPPRLWRKKGVKP